MTMEKGSLVVMRKEPHFRDIVTAKHTGIEIPITCRVYTIAKGPYTSFWKHGYIEVVQLEGFVPGLELNAAYFIEIPSSKRADTIKSLN